MLLGAAAPCFTKREDFPYGIDKSAVDGLIQQTYTDRPSMLKNFSEIFFADPEKLSSEFKIWNLSLGLAAVGVHSPEFGFEKKYANVKDAVQTFGITYPVILDSDHGTWNAYGNNYWPRYYLIDTQGYIRYDHIGSLEKVTANANNAIEKSTKFINRIRESRENCL